MYAPVVYAGMKQKHPGSFDHPIKIKQLVNGRSSIGKGEWIRITETQATAARSRIISKRGNVLAEVWVPVSPWEIKAEVD